MADFRNVPESKNFSDRTGILNGVMRARINELFNFLMRPINSQQSFKNPYEHKLTHERPILPSDPGLLNSFFTDDTGDIVKPDDRYSEPNMEAQVLLRRMYLDRLRKGGPKAPVDLRFPNERKTYMKDY